MECVIFTARIITRKYRNEGKRLTPWLVEEIRLASGRYKEYIDGDTRENEKNS